MYGNPIKREIKSHVFLFYFIIQITWLLHLKLNPEDGVWKDVTKCHNWSTKCHVLFEWPFRLVNANKWFTVDQGNIKLARKNPTLKTMFDVFLCNESKTNLHSFFLVERNEGLKYLFLRLFKDDA